MLTISNLNNENVRILAKVKMPVIITTYLKRVKSENHFVFSSCCTLWGRLVSASKQQLNMTLNISAAHVETPCKPVIITVVHHSRTGVVVQRLARSTYNKVRFILCGVCMLSRSLFSPYSCWSYLKAPITKKQHNQ